MSYFQVADERIFISNGIVSVNLSREQFQQLEPDAVLLSAEIIERWTPENHFILNPDQHPAPEDLGDRPLYVERVEQYLAGLQSVVEVEELDERDRPDWVQFRALMLMHSAYFRIVTHSPMTQTLNAALVWMLGEVGMNPQVLPDVINTWNAIASIANPTGEEIRSLNQIGEVCRVPFRLDASGWMVIDA